MTDTRLGRRIRALALVTLLIGSLLPTVGGIHLTAPAAVFSAVLVTMECLRTLPKLPVGAGFALAIIGVLASRGFLSPPTTPYGHDKLSRLVTYTLISALAATLVRNRAGLVTFARTWLGVACVMAASTILVGQAADGRAGAFDSAPIWTSRALATALVILVWLRWRRNIGPPLAWLVGAFLVIAMFMTGSRGPLIGVALGVAALAISSPSRRSDRGLKILLAITAGILAVLTVPSIRTSRVGRLLVDPSADASAGQRDEILHRTISLIPDFPLGVGYGNWNAYVHPDPPSLVYPHNLFVEVTFEAGWLYGAFLIAVVGWTLVRLFRHARSGDSESWLVLGILVAETFAVSVSGDLSGRTIFAFLVLGYAVTRWPRRSLTRWPGDRPDPVDRSAHGERRSPAGAPGAEY